MKRGDAFPTSYLSQDDLPAPPGTAHAVIEDVRTETMPGDDGEKPVMYFQGDTLKALVMNQTNWQIIEASYGDESDNWRGKQIELYIDPNVMYAGKRTGGVRVRIPASPTVAAQPGWTLEEALAHCDSAGISKDKLKAAITAAGGNGWNPQRDTPIAEGLIRDAQPSTEPMDEADIPF